MEKIRWRNFPLFLIKGLIEVASFGEKKYGTYDFLKKDYTVNDHLDAAKRHIERGESPFESDYDEESNKLHFYHAAWRLLLVAHVIENRPKLDDRYKLEQVNTEENTASSPKKGNKDEDI